MKEHRFANSLLMFQAIAGAILFSIPTPVGAQSLASVNAQSSPRLQTAAEINQTLEMAREKLDGPALGSKSSDSRIGPDDLLNITVFEAPEMNSSVRVSATGDISMQLLGAVHVDGLTPLQLESVLQAQLRLSYMKDPHVGVFVQELQSHPVSVVGAVKMPGVFQIRGTKTVIEVLSMAQGLADDAGDTVLIMHSGGPDEPEYLARQHLPQTVAAPASRPQAELAKTDGAQSAVIETTGQIEEINLKKLLESSNSALNVPVRPGDIVKVPRAGIVYVVGEVNKPGGFVLQNNESISVLQALALAQGTTHTSAISHARLIHTDPATGIRTEFPMNIGKIVSGKKSDTFLQPNDIVFVPNSTTKSVLYRGSAAALQTAAGVAIYKW